MTELYRTFRGHRVAITASRKHFFDCDIQGPDLYSWFSFPKAGNDPEAALQEAMLQISEAILVASNIRASRAKRRVAA